MVMILNSSSAGNAFPFNFRKRNLGTVIGTRTWGRLVGQSGNAGLLSIHPISCRMEVVVFARTG